MLPVWLLPYLKNVAWPLARAMISRVPTKVWYALGIIIFLAWFAHWNKERGIAICQAQVQEASEREAQRQREADRQAIEAAELRAKQASDRLAQLEEQLNEAVRKAQLGKDANRVCLPADVTRGLRSPVIRK